MNEFDANSFNGENFIKLLSDWCEQTHTKDFLIFCPSKEIKKYLENLDINYNFDIIVEPNIQSINCQEDTFLDNEKTIYVIPKPELKNNPIRVISEPVDIPIKFLCKGEDFYDFM